MKLQNPKTKPSSEARLIAFRSGLVVKKLPQVPLELAIMSATVLELTLEVATALQPLAKDIEQPEELRPPMVTVAGGSIQFTVGGPLLASGVGLAVAVSAGMVAAPIAAPAAAFLSVMGVVDVAVGWWKTIAEGSKSFDDAIKSRAEAAKTTVDLPTKEEAEMKRALERRQLELAILKAEKELAAMSGAPSAASSLISPEEVRRQAEIWGLSEPARTHLLNRSLPKAIAARKAIGPMDAHPVEGKMTEQGKERTQ